MRSASRMFGTLSILVQPGRCGSHDYDDVTGAPGVPVGQRPPFPIPLLFEYQVRAFSAFATLTNTSAVFNRLGVVNVMEFNTTERNFISLGEYNIIFELFKKNVKKLNLKNRSKHVVQ